MNNIDIHPIQAKILCELLFVNSSGFKELNKTNLGSDLFSFHLRQLTGWKLIIKNEDEKYILTTKGKEYANRFDTDAAEVEKQPKITMVVIGVKEVNGETLYLAQQRLKQPYYGFWGFIGGKVRWGEKSLESAQRELMEEAGLTADLTLIGLRHKMDYSQQNELLEDKYFLTFRASSTKGKLVETFEGGKNQWMTKDQLLGQEDLFDDIEEILNMVEDDQFKFVEKSYKVKRY